MPAPANVPKEVPLGLSVWIWGDGSGHKVALRMYDSTDERFVSAQSTVDWTGWKLITFKAPESWSHYLGNEDGKFDLPLKSVAVELTSVSGAPVKGALYVDDITVDYASRGSVVISDFERTLRYMHLTMAGGPNTTVVIGKGLGPDLTRPVPFAMARRYARDAQFVALFQPHGEPAKVQSMADGTILVEGAAFSDAISLAGSDSYCPVTVTRYFKDSGRPRVSWKGCWPGKFTPRKP
jgi:hypothetical protein